MTADCTEFSVVEFYKDGTHSYVWRNTTAEDAVKIALSRSRAAVSRVFRDHGTTRTTHIIITDGGDNTVFEWTRGKGITYPSFGEIG